jgi:hypothetical protein
MTTLAVVGRYTIESGADREGGQSRPWPPLNFLSLSYISNIYLVL